MRSVRQERGLTLDAAASLAGISVRTLLHVEHGDHAASLTTLGRIATALDVPVTELVTPAAA